MISFRSIISVSILGLVAAGCSTPTPQIERFAVDLDEGSYINNEVPIIDPVAQPQPEGVHVGTIHASKVDCPQMPCNKDEKLATEQAYWDEFRVPADTDT